MTTFLKGNANNRILVTPNRKLIRSPFSPGADITSGLIFYWTMDDNAATTTVLDSSVNGRNGTANFNTSDVHVAGHKNGALTHDGVSRHIESNYTWSVSDPHFTITAWVRFSTVGDNWSIYSDYGGQPGFMVLGFNNGGHFQGYGYDSTGAYTFAQADTYGSLADGNWHHIACVMSNSGQTVTLYIDGAVQPDVGSNPTSTGIWHTALGTSGKTGLFPGDIDELRLYNRALTADEILAVYNF